MLSVNNIDIIINVRLGVGSGHVAACQGTDSLLLALRLNTIWFWWLTVATIHNSRSDWNVLHTSLMNNVHDRNYSILQDIAM